MLYQLSYDSASTFSSRHSRGDRCQKRRCGGQCRAGCLRGGADSDAEGALRGLGSARSRSLLFFDSLFTVHFLSASSNIHSKKRTCTATRSICGSSIGHLLSRGLSSHLREEDSNLQPRGS